MKFSTGLPGINLYPPITNDWERSMGPGDYQLVARTADEVGFHSLAIHEHIVIPNDMVGLMGPSWSHAMTAMSFVAGAVQTILPAFDPHANLAVLQVHDIAGQPQRGGLALDVVTVPDPLHAPLHHDLGGAAQSRDAHAGSGDDQNRNAHAAG